MDMCHSTPGGLHLNRRDALRTALAAAALLTVAACGSTGWTEELDAATSRLARVLDEVAQDDAQRDRLHDIGRRIEMQARELLALHVSFRDEFDVSTADRAVDAAELRRKASEYERERVSLRNDLLLLQDELRSELGEAEWDRAVEALSSGAATLSQSKHA